MMSFVGPPLEEGPLPALIYLALSQEESLYQDPYNQPVVYLKDRRLRVFSVSLPAHGPQLKSQDAIGAWAREFAEGKNPLEPFLEKVTAEIEALRDVATQVGLMGLSRGGLICGHLAARIDIKAWVAFAPLTKLTGAMEFQELRSDPLVQQYDLEKIVPKIAKAPARLYISNRDTRVGTKNCFELVEKLANSAYEQGLRSPAIELIVSPPIGMMGHGTSKEFFCDGAKWIANRLEAE